MARHFTLVATNVPYLASRKQSEELRTYLSDSHSMAKADLATARRSVLGLLFAGRFDRSRHPAELALPRVLQDAPGMDATEYDVGCSSETWVQVLPDANGDFNVALLIHTTTEPATQHGILGIDVSACENPDAKM